MIYHQNMRFAAKKKDLLEEELRSLQPDYICLSEVALQEDEIENFTLSNYFLASSYCRPNTMGRGGGVAIYLRTGLKFENVKTRHLCVAKIIEITAIKTKIGQETCILVAVYRPPRENSEDLEEAYTKLRMFKEDVERIYGNCKVVILGDMNICTIENSTKRRNLDHLLNELDLKNALLGIPTRITATSTSAIDHIYTNFPEDEYKAQTHHTAISDHLGTSICLNIKAECDSKRISAKKRKFSVENHSLFTYYLENENWASVFGSEHTTEAYQMFIDKITGYFNTSFPETVQSKQSRKKGFEGHPSIQSMSLKAKVAELTRIYQTSGTIEDKTLLSTAQKDYKSSLANDVRERNGKYIETATNKQKAMWEVVNNDRKPTTTDREELCLQDETEIVTDPHTLGNILNEAFLKKPQDAKLKARRLCEQAGISEAMTTPTPSLSFDLTLTDPQDVLNTIKSMKNTNACGPDNISTNLLKRNADHLVIPLTYIANLSFGEGTFPAQLLTSKVIPVFKRKGSRKDKNCYRPIALTSVFSKLLEKLFKKRLTEFLIQNKILSPQQFGFQTGKSTTDAIIEAIEEISKNSDAKQRTVAAFLDLTAAFDCVDHDILFRKLKGIGLGEIPLRWVRTFLGNRQQYVFVNGVASEVLQVTMGVPQGTVLGPLLYLIYVNSILKDEDENAKKIMFADDTTALVKGKNLKETASNCETVLKDIRLEFAAHGLLLNESKTNLLVMHHRGSEPMPEITLGEVTIQPSPHARFLGVEIDSGLNWTAHIELLNLKLHCNLFVIRRLSIISPRKVSLQAFHALIMSHIEYGILAWGGTSSSNLTTILRLQKRGIRHILGLNIRDSCRDHFKELEVLTVPALYIFKCIMLVSSTTELTNIPRNGDTHDYNTRQRNEARTERHRLVTCDRSTPRQQGLRFLQALPGPLKDLFGCITFKTKLKKFLTDKALYSTDEFFNH